MPKALRRAGIEYVVLDDAHFALAGLEPETLGGYYLTEEQGATLAIFPISQRLRYLVPFAEPAETIRYLGERRGSGAVTLFDDGEKSAWPGTHRLAYDEGWPLLPLKAGHHGFHLLVLRRGARGRTRVPAHGLLRRDG
jgi:alpha-amylase